VKIKSAGAMVEDRGKEKGDGGAVEGRGGVYVGERRERESMKFPASRLVGERGTWRERFMS
jgi:hypothetical protein